MTFGARLRRLRGQRSQKEIAESLDMPITTLSTLENQSKIPRGEVLTRLAEYFGVPLIYFYTESDSPSHASDAARTWLNTLRAPTAAKQTVALHSEIDVSESIKEQIADVIREKKNANAKDK